MSGAGWRPMPIRDAYSSAKIHRLSVQSESRVAFLNVPYISAYIAKVMRRCDGSHTPPKKGGPKAAFC
jgi:hypothetical protein